ncbi:MAG TPA: exosortase A, partial [Acetobacteraceae bacterium]|nr:exosortase A [Acetobacteraceae bacterium]
AWLVAERLGIMEGRQLVAMTFAELLFFTLLGPRLWWRLAGPLLYLYFLVPFGAFLTPKLQDITTIFVDHGLRFLHIPAYVTGYTIEIPEGTFLVAEACAGLRFLIAAVAFGCLYALVMYRSPIRRAVFIGVSIIVPIIANGFRALGIVAIGHVLGSAEAAETDHVLYGWIFFSIVILVLIALGLPFREDTAAGAPGRSLPGLRSGDFRDHLRSAVFGAVGLIVLAAIGPAIAAALDQRALPDMLSDLPSLMPAAPCRQHTIPLTVGLDAPGRMIVQSFDCGQGPVTLSIEVFSPRSIASRMLAEQRRLTDVIGADDVQSHPLSVPGSPQGSWRLVARTNPNRVAATSLWIDGKPAELGLVARARQAWHSIAGSAYSPVLVVVTPAHNPDDASLLARQRAAHAIAQFLESQPDLDTLIARLSGPAQVKG